MQSLLWWLNVLLVCCFDTGYVFDHVLYGTVSFSAPKCTKTKRELIMTISNIKQELGGPSWKRIISSIFEITRIEWTILKLNVQAITFIGVKGAQKEWNRIIQSYSPLSFSKNLKRLHCCLKAGPGTSVGFWSVIKFCAWNY